MSRWFKIFLIFSLIVVIGSWLLMLFPQKNQVVRVVPKKITAEPEPKEAKPKFERIYIAEKDPNDSTRVHVRMEKRKLDEADLGEPQPEPLDRSKAPQAPKSSPQSQLPWQIHVTWILASINTLFGSIERIYKLRKV